MNKRLTIEDQLNNIESALQDLKNLRRRLRSRLDPILRNEHTVKDTEEKYTDVISPNSPLSIQLESFFDSLFLENAWLNEIILQIDLGDFDEQNKQVVEK